MLIFIGLKENFILYKGKSQVVIKCSLKKFMEKFKMGYRILREISPLIQMLPDSNR